MALEPIPIDVDGPRFRVLRHGRGEPLVLLHGFTGRAESWLPLCDRLADDYALYAIDLIGHGESSAPEDCGRYRFDRAVDDLAAVVAGLGIERASWLGYSLGGRLALGVAIAHPACVSGLILESATAGLQDEGGRAERRASDEALAMRIEADGIAAFVAAWEALPMWASQRALPPDVLAAQREGRLANTPAGLANSLRGMGQGAQPSLWHRLGEVRAPTLLIAGGQDTKYAEIAARMRQRIANAEFCLIPDAGHAVHLERPERFSEAVRGFLNRGSSTTRIAPEEVAR